MRSGKDKNSIDLLTIENGQSLNELSYEKFKTTIAKKPYMYISTTPTSPNPELIDVDSEKIKNIFTSIPDLRSYGWTVMNANFNFQRIKDGISFGDENSVYLKLLENGHSELWVIIDESFCWLQSEEDYLKQPKLYPIPVIEYPLSFLNYYKTIIELWLFGNSLGITVKK